MRKTACADLSQLSVELRSGPGAPGEPGIESEESLAVFFGVVRETVVEAIPG